MLAALLLATATVGSSAEPQKVSALDAAASFCQWKVGRRDGQFNLPSDSVLYENLGADVVALMKQRGMPVGPTFTDLPELVVRFASTQPAGRLSGMPPRWFEYMSFGRGSAKAWTVSYPQMPACDVMVTGSTDYFADRNALLERMQKDGWIMLESATGENSPVWKMALSKQAESDGSKIMATMQGLSPERASIDGVQMEIQFVQSVGQQ